jgi:signal peptidase I
VRVESRRAYRLAFILFWSIILYVFCEEYIVSLGIITDRSMLPILPDGSYFLVNKYAYRLSPPQRGDVVVLRVSLDEPEPYVKRVIGLEGETLLIRAGDVYINGQLLSEPYALGATLPDLGPYQIEENRYFVMGDNRTVSEDSRHFGSVPRNRIDGKITPEKLFPFH